MHITGELHSNNTVGTGVDLKRLKIAATLQQNAMAGRRITLRIEPPSPLGDFTLVPSALSGRPEAETARAMAAAFAEDEAPTAAEALKRLRQAFLLAPFSARLDAIAAMMTRVRPPVLPL